MQDFDPPPSAANAAATSPSRGGVISRFAPSPTGHLHLGHAYSAALGHARARESGGKFLLRIEDLDPTRSRPEFVNGIYEDLSGSASNGISRCWSSRSGSAVYAEALDRLRAQGLVYACFCTRADIAAALEAPHGPAGAHYPGTCRALPHDPQRRAAMPHCWRLDSVKALEIAGFPEWTEDEGRRFSTGPDDFDDVILARKDAPAAYHLAVRRRRCGDRRDARRAGSRPALLDPDPAPAADFTRPSGARPTPTIRWSRTPTADASPSATAPRRSPRCARTE